MSGNGSQGLQQGPTVLDVISVGSTPQDEDRIRSMRYKEALFFALDSHDEQFQERELSRLRHIMPWEFGKNGNK